MKLSKETKFNPCLDCGFYDEDYGCTADPYQPWTVPKDCYLYRDLEIEQSEGSEQ